MITIETQGIHPSTGLCLEALQWLHERHDFHNILDMGCGNGILSITAATIWEAKVLAVDISEKAIEDANKNIRLQDTRQNIALLRSDGFTDPLIHTQAPYDLIICNMLAEFTVETAREVKTYLAAGGICLLAGILAWKAETVKTVYKTLGFEIIKEMSISPWHCTLLRHTSATEKNATVTKA